MVSYFSMDHSNALAKNSDAHSTVVRDPVCGMAVNPMTASYHAEFVGSRYYCCSAKCRGKFVANPNSYVGSKHDTSPKTSTGTIYTCPMHPQIRQDRPGNCPICGMTLETLIAAVEHVHNLELADMTRRLIVSVGLSIS